MGIESAFQKLGLAEYESKALAALVRRHDATAQYISDSMNIPYTKIYHVLESLENRGLIKSTLERPKKYRPIEPENIIDAIISKKRDDIKRLEKDAKNDLKDIKKAFQEGEHFQGKEKIWYLPTEKAVWDGVVDLLKKSKKSAVVAIGAEVWKSGFLDERVAKAIYGISKKGVETKGIMPSSLQLSGENVDANWLKHLSSKKINIRIIDDSKLLYDILVVDGEKIGFSFKDLKTGKPISGMLIEDKAIAQGTENYFNILWNQSAPVNDIIRKSAVKALQDLEKKQVKTPAR